MNQLQRIIPDLDRLLDDPRTVLTGQQIWIEPPKLGVWHWAAALFAFVAAVFLVALIAQSIWVTALFIVGGPLAVFWATRYTSSPHILIHGKGVEFWLGRSVVFCPWELFNSTGRQLLSESSSRAGIIIPIQASAVPKVFHSRGGRVQAIGVRVHCPHVSIISADDLSLLGEYQASLADIGELLLALGRRLGATPGGSADPQDDSGPQSPLGSSESFTASIPAGKPASTAVQTNPSRLPSMSTGTTPPADRDRSSLAEDGESYAISSRGRLLIGVTRLSFPPFCSSCCAPTQDTFAHTLTGGARYVPFVGTVSQGVTVPIPRCAACRRQARLKILFWAAVGVGCAIALGIVAGMHSFLNGRPVAGLLISGGIAYLGVLTLLLSRMNVTPVRYDAYFPDTQRVELEFRNRDYAKLLGDHLRAATG